MKVLQVNTSDIQGGAARAAYRLHRALLDAGIDSQMLVQDKMSDDFTVIASESKIHKGLALLRPHFDTLPVKFYKNRTKTLFSPAWLPSLGLVDRINVVNPDLVHLQWINAGLLHIEDLAKIKAPIVWSLHDMWAFTGGCHYDENCKAYKQRCGHCKVLACTKEYDLSRYIHNRKAKAFKSIANLTGIGLSRWMADCAKESSLLGDRRVVNLPNPLNTTVFAPIDSLQAREIFNLPTNKKLVLFGAIEATSDLRKGFNELCNALSLLGRGDVELVVFGSSQPDVEPGFNHKAHYLGHLHDDISLRVLYSAADVMVVPSLQEAFGQTASEAMACKTPVVAFATTGLLDIVDHQVNGYLAQPFACDDLAKGINWVLDAENYAQLCINAREKVVTTFDSRLVAQQYITLYRELIECGEVRKLTASFAKGR